MHFIVTTVVTTTVIAALGGVQPASAKTLDEAAATKAAISILKGDPYGDKPADVLRHIKDRVLVIAGTMCGNKVTKPLWVFYVNVPQAERPDGGDNDIDGPLVIDASTGKMPCAGLPFLD